ncbi:unnamed protein product [Miscanthus lutarioriparius]|uniref:Uncharacterized protein n=1 Tax=Miscanthus lutarioriparius TaxID=422564 RepID=A0A811QMM5_9POAL|nr:unnamed protein product [Miscanthus lutarioriparius]
MWKMEEGLLIDTSRALGGTIRAIAADSRLLVSGGTNAYIQCWRAVEGNDHLFHISGSGTDQNAEFRLWGHEDWVWSLALRGNTVASTAGRDAYVWDIRDGELTSLVSNAHVGNAYSLAWTHLADVLFTGGEDGAIRLFNVSDVSDDEEDIKPVATWVPHSGPVHSLAFEYPWLVSASSDGRIALIDLRKLLTPKRSSKDRIVCAGEDGSVRVWNFSEALEIERRAQALRSLRQENRMRRRKAQVEMNANGRRPDQCSIAMKKNQLKGDKSTTWHNKRTINEKVKS